MNGGRRPPRWDDVLADLSAIAEQALPMLIALAGIIALIALALAVAFSRYAS